MAAWENIFWTDSVLLFLMVVFCSPVCVEVQSGTEAVKGENMTLLCISCMKREEVAATTNVRWFYQPEDGQEILIYEYDGKPLEIKSPLQGRLQWTGSKDLQDVSITILNVTTNDTGVFTCYVNRTLHFDAHRHSTQSKKSITLKVMEEAGEDFTSVLSKIMMYLLLAFLTFWLLVEIAYCYRKISKADEVTQESVTDYLAIPSETKENCSVPVEE